MSQAGDGRGDAVHPGAERLGAARHGLARGSWSAAPPRMPQAYAGPPPSRTPLHPFYDSTIQTVTAAFSPGGRLSCVVWEFSTAQQGALPMDKAGDGAQRILDPPCRVGFHVPSKLHPPCPAPSCPTTPLLFPPAPQAATARLWAGNQLQLLQTTPCCLHGNSEWPHMCFQLQAPEMPEGSAQTLTLWATPKGEHWCPAESGYGAMDSYGTGELSSRWPGKHLRSQTGAEERGWISSASEMLNAAL